MTDDSGRHRRGRGRGDQGRVEEIWETTRRQEDRQKLVGAQLPREEKLGEPQRQQEERQEQHKQMEAQQEFYEVLQDHAERC